MPTESGSRVKKWQVNQEKTKEHWLEVEDPEGWYSAAVKWDGCIHFSRYFNEPFSKDMEDCLHICEIDDMVERLQQLKQVAQTHFGKAWPNT